MVLPIFQPVPASIGCRPLISLSVITLGFLGASGGKIDSWLETQALEPYCLGV